MKALLTVATFNDPEKAAILKERLEKAGILVEMSDESTTRSLMFFSKGLASVRLQVEKADWDRARKMLVEWDAADGALRDALHCPECKSPRVSFPQLTRKFPMPLFVFSVLVKVGLIDPEFYCEDCHFTWPEKEPVKPDLDVLNWPKK
jgi:hypothetical protein